MSDKRSDHDFLPLSTADFNDAGDKGLAVRFSTQPSPKRGKRHHIGFLLDAESGKKLLRGLASALAKKFPDDVVSGD